MTTRHVPHDPTPGALARARGGRLSGDCWLAICAMRNESGPWVVRAGRVLAEWAQFLTPEEVTYVSAGTRAWDGERLRFTPAGRYLIERLSRD